MATTKRNKILFLIILVLTLINVAAAVSVFFHVQNHREVQSTEFKSPGDSQTKGFDGSGMIKTELGFSDEQAENLRISRDSLRRDLKPYFNQIKGLNQLLIDEVLKENPDTLLIRSLCTRIGENHAQVRYRSAKHLIEMRKIADPEQLDRLEDFFREMIMRDEVRKGEHARRGYRRGQNR